MKNYLEIYIYIYTLIYYHSFILNIFLNYHQINEFLKNCTVKYKVIIKKISLEGYSVENMPLAKNIQATNYYFYGILLYPN